MPLIPIEEFAPIFESLKGLFVGLVDGHGNVGDQLIYRSTRQLLGKFSIPWVCQSLYHRPLPVDVLLLFGGGNMGGLYPEEQKLRRAALSRRIPCILLPQSFSGPEPGNYLRMYVRDRESMRHCPQGLLAPDMALGYQPHEELPEPEHSHGLFLRADDEGLFRDHPGNRGDPAGIAFPPEDYLRLAARYRSITTDRLHFAICGLIAGRTVTLLPNSYHKNRSMWETWLVGLGCQWREHP